MPYNCITDAVSFTSFLKYPDVLLYQPHAQLKMPFERFARTSFLNAGVKKVDHYCIVANYLRKIIPRFKELIKRKE